MTQPVACYDRFEERSAIYEFEAGYSRWLAEQRAAFDQGYNTSVELLAATKRTPEGYCDCPFCRGQEVL